MIRLTMPTMYTEDAEAPTYIAELDKWDIRFLKYGYPRVKVGNNVRTEIQFLKVADFLMLENIPGIKIEYFKPYIKIAQADFDNELPVGLPNRTKTVTIDDSDPENIITEEQVKTWREWQRGNIVPQLNIDGYYYVRSSYGNTNGASLTDRELYAVNGSADAELVDSIPVEEEVI